MKDSITISVIVPIYNSEKYLEKCLDSIRVQSYENLQIICVDDGSTDGSSDIARQFADSDRRFKYIRENNQGESHARNRGLSLSTGDYICFVDCDDYIDRDMYKTLLSAAVKNNTDITACGWIKEFEDHTMVMGNSQKINGTVLSKEEFLHYVYCRDEYQAFAYMWNKLFKRSVIFENGGTSIISFDESLRLGGDVLFMAEAMINSKRFAYIDESLYHYVQRPDSTTHISSLQLKQDQIRTYEKVISIMSDAGIEPDTLKLIKRFYVYHCSNLAELAYQTGQREVFFQTQEKIRRNFEEYRETNLQHPERINRIEELLRL